MLLKKIYNKEERLLPPAVLVHPFCGAGSIEISICCVPDHSWTSGKDSKKMTSRVLLVDNYDSFTFNLVQLLEESGECLVEVVKNDSIDLSRGSEYDKILLSPGPGVPREAGRLLEFLQTASPTCSILGVCLGHQAIAEFFGASLVRTPEVAHGVTKEVMVEVTDDPLFRGVAKKFPAGLYHSWAVDPASLPSSLRVTARSTDGVIMAISHKSRDIRGIQFHPESVMTPNGSALIRNWLLM